MLCIIGNFNFQTIDTSKQLDQLNVNRNYGSETKYLGKQSTENKFPREGYNIESEKVLRKDTPSLNQQTTRNVSHSNVKTVKRHKGSGTLFSILTSVISAVL